MGSTPELPLSLRSVLSDDEKDRKLGGSVAPLADAPPMPEDDGE